MVFRFPFNLLLLSLLLANIGFASEALLTVSFQGMKSDTKIEGEIKDAVDQILEFSHSNQLGIRTGEPFITKATVYGTKSSFDSFIEASPGWKAGAKVPATYVGFGEKRALFVISWTAYQGVHPSDSHSEYEKLIVHEIAHLFHAAYLKNNEDKMGPVWFYEGFACVVADQYKDATLPKDFASVINSPERASYRDYVAIIRKLRKKYSVRELLDKASDKNFNSWAISALRE